jgi:hypothetical protein
LLLPEKCTLIPATNINAATEKTIPCDNCECVVIKTGLLRIKPMPPTTTMINPMMKAIIIIIADNSAGIGSLQKEIYA